jgi:hypothetical protein
MDVEGWPKCWSLHGAKIYHDKSAHDDLGTIGFEIEAHARGGEGGVKQKSELAK